MRPHAQPPEIRLEHGLWPIDELARSMRAFDQRLYRGLLMCRVVLPVATLATQLDAYEQGTQQRLGVLVWGVLALWMSLTTPYAWNRLDQLRRFPVSARIESTVLVALVFLGLGSREWHFLHCFVPLVFTAFFVGERACRRIAAGMLGALWLADLEYAVRPDLSIGRLGPLDTRLTAVMPTILVIASVSLLTYVRRLMQEVDHLIADQRTAAAEIATTRRVIAHSTALAEAHRKVTARLLDASQALVATAERVQNIDLDSDSITRLARAIREAITELHPVPAVPTRERRTLESETESAIARTSPHGRTVSLEGRSDHPINPSQAHAVARLLTELITNARKHGHGEITVAIGAHSVSVSNRASGPLRPRTGGRGLADTATDAQHLGATLETTWDGRSLSRVVTLPPPSDNAPADIRQTTAPAFREAISRREHDYLSAVVVARAAVAVATTVLVLVKADQHRTLLWPIFATGLAFIAWNCALLTRRERLTATLRTPSVQLWDAGALVLALGLEGGMASPWIPLSLGTLLVAGFIATAQRLALVVVALALPQLAGYGLFLALPIDDAGTRHQDFPQGFVFNVLLYVAVGLIAGGVGWIFGAVANAAATCDATLHELDNLRGAQASEDARGEARRTIHATLEQYVAAARLRLSIWPDAEPGSAERALRDQFASIDTQLNAINSELAEPRAMKSPRESRRL
ncbi:MAG TPA: hypothetical protein VGO31_13015 [Microbacteriaceae bacterium]|jgi:two-component sensor histidine kinase|nr:hypothetical protein [Microbacteriaceae bacterium]